MGYPAFAIVAATFKDADEAKSVARHLTENKLAACVNIIPQIVSVYRWEGEVHEGAEAFALIKTSWERRQDVIDAVKILHSYDVPGIEVWPVEDAPEDFRRWVIHESAKF